MENLQVLIIEDDPADIVLVRNKLSESDPDSFTLHEAASLIEGLDKLALMHIDVILLDANLPDSQGLEGISTVRANAPDVPIVMLTGSDSELLQRGAVETGAQDYLVKDQWNGKALARTLRYAVQRCRNVKQSTPASESKLGRTIGLMGAKGGVGTTTVACHLAVELHRQTAEPVLLADLNVNAGSVGFLTQAGSPFSILDVFDNIHRLDFTFWTSIVTRISDGLDVLGSPGLYGAAQEPSVGRILHILQCTRQHYAWIVLDLGQLNGFSALLLKKLDELLLVTTFDILALHETRRVVNSLLNHGFNTDSLSIIQNQVPKWSVAGDVLRKVAEMPIRAELCACENELQAAYIKGKLLGEGAKFRKELADLAATLTRSSKARDANWVSNALEKWRMKG